ncbi:hypothetical protein OA93_09660 [Flavobacterium sp. KMS]|uniref:hypothetical protein n=1 Tax=Flavobacterium sp. KMS TaxID=1566023 RepID=UPI00057F23C4|nr:hypothetical protein [Flavobacterium sp. KMS]KIA98375.1 hypothetical protein OA93_09660 [Flavobacterium sp. KMS]
MNKIILLLLILIVSISCQKSKIENLQNEIESIIKPNLNDPSSYEFNSMHLDSVEYLTSKLEIQTILKDIRNLQKENNKISQEQISFLKRKIHFYSSLDKYKFKGNFSFRGNNKFGAKILAEYIFEADSTYKLIYIRDNNGDTIYKNIRM